MYDNNSGVKCRRAFISQVKVNSEIDLEKTKPITEGDYGHGIRKSKPKVNEKASKTKKSNPCTCGGAVVHFRSSSKCCLKTKKPKRTK